MNTSRKYSVANLDHSEVWTGTSILYILDLIRARYKAFLIVGAFKKNVTPGPNYQINIMMHHMPGRINSSHER